MTHEDRATLIVNEYIPASAVIVNRAKLRDAIHAALIDGCNAELERKRSAESQLQNVRAGGPIVVIEKSRVSLRVWNPESKSWWQTEMTNQDSYISQPSYGPKST
jgi:hypothetical protein